MDKETLLNEIKELCQIAGKQIEEKRDAYDLVYTDYIKKKAVIENVKVIDSTNNIKSISEICRQFQNTRKPDEHLYIVGLNIVHLAPAFSELPEGVSGNVWLLSYFDFFRFIVNLDIVPYLKDQQDKWAEYINKEPHHVPVRLYRRKRLSHGWVPHDDDFFGLDEYLANSNELNLELCYGEYGVGKSVFVLQVENILASRYLRNPIANRIPIRIPLIDYREKSRIEDLIKRTINIETGAEGLSEAPFPNDKVLWRLVEAGRFLFLLDAVDEMAALDSNDKETKRYPILQLLRLHFQNGKLEFQNRLDTQDELLVHGDILPKARALWTCRTTFFNSYNEIGKDEQVGKALELIPQADDLFVSPFDLASVKETFEKVSPELWGIIQNTFGFKELAQTALWFQMILHGLLDKIENGEEILSYQLLKQFMDAANEREKVDKKRDLYFDHQIHEKAIEWLACALHQRRNLAGEGNNPRLGFTFEQIKEKLFKYLETGLPDSKNVDLLLDLSSQMQKLFQAVRLCSFLSRHDPIESNQGYYFYPEPFESYFVTQRLLDKDYEAQKLSITDYLTNTERFPIGEGVKHLLCEIFSHQEATKTLSKRFMHQYINGWIEFPRGLFVYWDEDTKRDYVQFIEEFAIKAHPVTVKEYREFLRDYPEMPRPFGWDQDIYRQYCPTDECPVVNVKYEEAQKYCEWLSEKEAAGFIVRLPTDQQWQRAARGMDGRTYHWGMTLPKAPKDLCNGLEHWQEDGGKPQTTPVGAFEPKPFDLCDMIGNVWEYSCVEMGGMVMARGASFYNGKERWRLFGFDRREQCKEFFERSGIHWDVGFRPVKVRDRER